MTTDTKEDIQHGVAFCLFVAVIFTLGWASCYVYHTALPPKVIEISR